MAGNVLADLVARLRLDTKNFDHGMKGVNAQLGRVETNTRRTSSALAGLGKGFAGLAVAGAAGTFFKSSINAASDLNETVSKSRVIFGASEKAVSEFAKTAAKSIGQSRQAALEATASFGNMFSGVGIAGDQAADFSIQLTKLASDFASFQNTNPADAANAIQRAFIGEFDPLQKYIPAARAAAIEQQALSMGLAKTTKEIDAQDRALATFTYIMENAGAATGDFERTQGSLANQQRTLEASVIDLKAAFGTELLPAVSDFVEYLNTTGIPTLARWSAAFTRTFGGGLDFPKNKMKGRIFIKEFLKDPLGVAEGSKDEVLRRKYAAVNTMLNDAAKATDTLGVARGSLAALTKTSVKVDVKATETAEKLAKAQESLARAHRRVEDAVFDLADAEDDLREAQHREGVGSEAAIKAERQVGRARIDLADAQAGVAEQVRDIAEANKAAAEAISTGLSRVALSVDALAAALGVSRDTALASMGDTGNILSGSTQVTINTTGDVSNIVGHLNRELDWANRGRRIATRTQ